MVQRTREVEITGIKEFRKMCNDFAPKEARNLARSTVHAVAGRVRKEMRKRTPKDEGTLRKSIKAVRRKMQGDVAISDVRIEHGRTAKHDAFYWHMIEFGAQQRSATPFIVPTVDALAPQMTTIFREEFAKKLQKTLERKAKQQRVR